MQLSAVQYSIVQYNKVKCRTVQYSIVQYSTLHYSTLKLPAMKNDGCRIKKPLSSVGVHEHNYSKAIVVPIDEGVH